MSRNSALREMLAELRQLPHPNSMAAEMSPLLADFLASRVDDMYACLIFSDGKLSMEDVVRWLEIVRHGINVHNAGGDPLRSLPPHHMALLERNREAFDRAVAKRQFDKKPDREGT